MGNILKGNNPMNMSNRQKKTDPNKEEYEKCKEILIGMELYEEGMKLKDMRHYIDFVHNDTIPNSNNDDSNDIDNEKSSQKSSSELNSALKTSKKENSGKAEEKIVKKPMELILPPLKDDGDDGADDDDDDDETKIINLHKPKCNKLTTSQYVNILKISYDKAGNKTNNPTKERSQSPDLFSAAATADRTFSSDKPQSSSSSSFKNTKSKNTWKESTADIMSINVLKCKFLENDVPLKGRKFDPPPPPVYHEVDGEIIIPADALAKQIQRLTVASNYHRRVMMKPNADQIKWEAPIKAAREVGNESFGSTSFTADTIQSDDNDSLAKTSLRDRKVDSRYNFRSILPKTKISDYYLETEKPSKLSRKSPIQMLESTSSHVEDDFDKIKKAVNKKSTFVAKEPSKRAGPKKKTVPDLSAYNLGSDIEITAVERPPSPVYDSDESITPSTPKTTKSNNKTIKNKQLVNKKNKNLKDEELGLIITNIEDNKIDNVSDNDSDVIMEETRFPTTKRIIKGTWHLTKSNQTRENRKRKQDEDAEIKKEFIKRDRQDKVDRARQSELEKEEMKKEEDKIQKERADRYVNCRKYTRRVEIEGENSKKSAILMNNSVSIHKSIKLNKSSETEEKANCPICNKLFKISELENHASTCEAYSQEDSENDVAGQSFKCRVCSLVTRSEREHTEHQTECVQALITDDDSNKITSEDDVQFTEEKLTGTKRRTRQKKNKN